MAWPMDGSRPPVGHRTWQRGDDRSAVHLCESRCASTPTTSLSSAHTRVRSLAAASGWRSPVSERSATPSGPSWRHRLEPVVRRSSGSRWRRRMARSAVDAAGHVRSTSRGSRLGFRLVQPMGRPRSATCAPTSMTSSAHSKPAPSSQARTLNRRRASTRES
jgi:hypothetical protein